jgi:hypothetical protein
MHGHEDQGGTTRAAIFHDEKSIYLMRRGIAALVCIIVEDIPSFLFFSLRCIWIYGYDLNGRELERGACD